MLHVTKALAGNLLATPTRPGCRRRAYSLSAEAMPAKRARRCGQPPPARARHRGSTRRSAEEGSLFISVDRVRSAVERRGKPIDDDRLDIEIALLICHWYDAAALN
jgi:hypothetical protein